MNPLILVASAARSTSDVGTAQTLPRNLKAIIFFLNVTVAASAADDKLDVWIQESPDGGTTQNDIVRFTQVLGNGSAKKFIAILNCEAAAETELAAPQDAAMAAGVRQGPIAPLIRPKWVVTVGAGTHIFTFAITMHLIR